MDGDGMASDDEKGEKARVLLVDDERALRRVMRRALEQAGFEVVEAGNGEEALASAQRGRVDLVVTDVQMPVMNGLELVAVLSGKRPDLPVVLMSGSVDASAAEAATGVATCAFLRKPFVMAELKRCAVRAMRGAARESVAHPAE